MVYIAADGSIGGQEQSRRNRYIMTTSRKSNVFATLRDRFLNLDPHWKAVLLVIIAYACRQWLSPNPLANGSIPAATLEPHQHYQRIAQDDFFVRLMTSNLGRATHWKGKTESKKSLAENSNAKDVQIDMMLDKVDFGGPDGHVAESGDWSDIKYVQTTRCSTTRSAITAYFCGAQVAENQDYALGEKRKGYNFGVQSLSDFIACRHQQGTRNGNSHRRSVYRIGIGSRDGLAGYSHAFNIVAQPDGSFYWLQSFISHYSLSQWMGGSSSSSNQAHLSLDELMIKLGQVQRLMNITSWTPQANQDYWELFGVDKEREAMKRSKSPVSTTWEPNHRLEYFYWDEACEYPVPTSPKTDDTNSNSDDINTLDSNNPNTLDESVIGPKTADESLKDLFGMDDECEYQNLLGQLKGATANF